jgi:ABC-type sugar transport system ATPase subunit
MIRCKDVHIEQGVFSLSEINFEIDKGDYIVMMGKTGCGKTTILEAVCGLRKINSGEIWFNGQEVSKYSPAKREIGYVPQDGALFKHMTIAQNIGFALKIRKWDKKKIRERVAELSDLLGISYLLEREAHDLSGGERQRVALARALSFYPDILCLDEPLSALDDATKKEMYNLLIKLKNDLDITVLHVSHSREDALKLADKVLVLSEGTLQQLEVTEL